MDKSEKTESSRFSGCFSMKKLFVAVMIGSLFFCYTFKYTEVEMHSIKEKYVSVCEDTFNSRRTGNMMFVLAALLFVSKFTGRNPVLPKEFPHAWLDQVFTKDLPRIPNKLVYNDNSVIVNEEPFLMSYDEKFRHLHRNETVRKAGVVLICGYFQSYRYVLEVEDELRDMLQFKNNTLEMVADFLEKEKTENSSLIGIHVRRTDFILEKSKKGGLTVVDGDYIRQAVRYVVSRFAPSTELVAVVCSDDIDWVKGTVETLNFTHVHPQLRILYSINHDAAFDLCLLSSCDASIISTGTYSWWSAWLANEITVYYSLYPRRNNPATRGFKHRDYYPPQWVGIPLLTS